MRRRSRGIEDYRKRFLVEPDEKLKLHKLDPDDDGGVKHGAAATATAKLHARLAELQELLYASRSAALLIVLQGLDAAGKDGTISHVMSAFNPQGATVAAFKVPTAEELAHDFLWRIHARVPGQGSIAIFNRSHYEDVLVSRVHRKIDSDTCEKRYADIRAFEALLAQSGTRIVKFFLHISKEEQLQRFAERLDDPAKNWKISEADYTERKYWNDYVHAYEDVLPATSRKHAPWYVIPSDHKWFRNLAVAQIVAKTLESMRLSYPPPAVDIDEIRRKYHAAQSGDDS